jgi:hypothetical protein
VPFVAGDDVHLVGLDLAVEHRQRLLALDALAQLLRHAPGVILVKARFLADLPVGQVQAHEIQA